MNWLKGQITAAVTLAALIVGGAIGYGRMEEMCTRIDAKADKDQVLRELDQCHEQLRTLDRKIDALLTHSGLPAGSYGANPPEYAKPSK